MAPRARRLGRLAVAGAGPLLLAAVLVLAAGCGAVSERSVSAESTVTLGDQAASEGTTIAPGAAPSSEPRDTLEGLTPQGRALVIQARRKVQDSTREVRETAVNDAVAAAGAAQFERLGHRLSGPLSCVTQSPTPGSYIVTCNGKTQDGNAVSLLGDDPGPGDADFVGTLNGQQVFRQHCVGLC